MQKTLTGLSLGEAHKAGQDEPPAPHPVQIQERS